MYQLYIDIAMKKRFAQVSQTILDVKNHCSSIPIYHCLEIQYSIRSIFCNYLHICARGVCVCVLEGCFMCARVFVYICDYECPLTCKFVYVCVNACLLVCMFTSMYICVYICICAMYVIMYVSLNVFFFVCM